jgi:hypothetical protein
LLANNDDLLNVDHDLSTDDIAAITQRIFKLDPGDNGAAAKAFLDTISPARLQEWVENDIAATVLWLTENRRVEERPGQRFWVSGVPTDWHDGFTFRTGLSGLVTQWIYRFLENPKDVERNSVALVSRGNGRLCLSTRVISQHWKAYCSDHPAPTDKRLGDTLAKMSFGQTAIRIGERRVRMWELNTDSLLANAERGGLADVDLIRKNLGTKPNGKDHVSPWAEKEADAPTAN